MHGPFQKHDKNDTNFRGRYKEEGERERERERPKL